MYSHKPGYDDLTFFHLVFPVFNVHTAAYAQHTSRHSCLIIHCLPRCTSFICHPFLYFSRLPVKYIYPSVFSNSLSEGHKPWLTSSFRRSRCNWPMSRHTNILYVQGDWVNTHIKAHAASLVCVCVCRILYSDTDKYLKKNVIKLWITMFSIVYVDCGINNY